MDLPCSEMAAARLAAFRLVEAVQGGDTGDALATQLATAERHGWEGVLRVLLYAHAVRAELAGDGSLEAAIDRLHQHAARGGDRAMRAAALAYRAEHRFRSESAGVQQDGEADLALATALLTRAQEGALERALAYVGCALAYSQRELWELEEEMYTEASALLPFCEEPVTDRVVLFNRVDTLLSMACSLRELGDTDALEVLLPRGMAAVHAALSGSVPEAWWLDARVARHLLAAVGDRPTDEDASTLRAELVAVSRPRSHWAHGFLWLADAARAANRREWSAAATAAECALELFDEVAPPPVVALALRLAAEAEAEATLGSAQASRTLAYAEHSARRQRDSRLRTLSAARVRVQAEQLRIERDHHAREAMVDELTGLANRRAHARFVEAHSRSRVPRRLAVLIVDIDHFKAVNDRYGHPVGDAVLMRVAEVLGRDVRAVDLAARLGGDEFVVLLDDVDETVARRRGRSILTQVEREPWESVSPGLRVSVSIGIAAGDGGESEALLEEADRALYVAKASGRDAVTSAPLAFAGGSLA